MLGLLEVIVVSIIAGVVGHLIVKPIMDRLWKEFYALPDAEESVGSKEIYKAVQPFVIVLGMIERMIYSGGWLLGKPEIITVLLIIKVTPYLKEWSENRMLGRAQFNIWLTGCLISVTTSVLIAQSYITYISPLFKRDISSIQRPYLINDHKLSEPFRQMLKGLLINQILEIKNAGYGPRTGS